MKLLKLILAAAIAFSATMAFACNPDTVQGAPITVNPKATMQSGQATPNPYTFGNEDTQQ